MRDELKRFLDRLDPALSSPRVDHAFRACYGEYLLPALRADAARLREALETPEPASGGDRCADCGRPYSEMVDFIIPLRVWERISPTGDEGGTLCVCCIASRLEAAGISGVPGAFMSGPIRTVDAVLMDTLRWTENLRGAVFPDDDRHPALAPVAAPAPEAGTDE